MPKKIRSIFVLMCVVTLTVLFAGSLPATGTGKHEHEHQGAHATMQDVEVGNPETGAETYEDKCAKCHGSGGTGGFAPSHVGCHLCDDYPALVIKIEDDMPKGDAKSCVGECASNTAAFIYVELNGNSL